jgi:ketosteroid isomerase-like protein
MHSIALITAMMLTTGLPTPTQIAERKSDDHQELLKLERTWNEAIVRHDATAINLILAEDYVLTTPWGHQATREQELTNAQSSGDGSFELKGVEQGELSVRIYGGTAVVTSRFTIKGQARNQDVRSPFRQTDVFIRRNGRWQCVSRQATPIFETSEPAPQHASQPVETPGHARSATHS